jgi:hypothetical protein
MQNTCFRLIHVGIHASLKNLNSQQAPSFRGFLDREIKMRTSLLVEPLCQRPCVSSSVERQGWGGVDFSGRRGFREGKGKTSRDHAVNTQSSSAHNLQLD